MNVLKSTQATIFILSIDEEPQDIIRRHEENGKEVAPPQEGAEEILKEFAENIIYIAMNVTPLHYLGGGLILL